MATAKKTPAKKIVAKTPAKKPVKAPVKAPVRAAAEEFRMPTEVKEWIDQAASRMKSMQGKIDRLETEITELKAYKKWAEHRILGSSYE
jgi:peptidoglycan hydrolase CwlO-like protein